MVWLTSQSVWLLVVGCLVIAIAVALGSRYFALWVCPQGIAKRPTPSPRRS